MYFYLWPFDCKLNLIFPKHEQKIISKNGKNFIWDIFRKKYIVLTPEEWVRQHLLHFLVNTYNYPASSIAVERVLPNSKKRFDAVVYKSNTPQLLIECKREGIPLNQQVVEQTSSYLHLLHVNHLLVTNGQELFIVKRELSLQNVKFLKEIPCFEQL